MAFTDYREPIEYVVSQYFERNKYLTKNQGQTGNTGPAFGQDINENLPEEPALLLRDPDTKKVRKVIYGEAELLLNDEEADPVVWQQELKYNSSGKVESVITTFPDGETVENFLKRDSNGKVEKYE